MNAEQALKKLPEKRITAEDALAGLPARSDLSRFAKVMPMIAEQALGAAVNQGPIQTPLNLVDPENIEKMNEVLGTPMRGLRGLGVTATSGIQRGGEAVKPGFKPEGLAEKTASFGAEMLDPRAMALNQPVGIAMQGALKVGGKAMGLIGRQAAKGISAFTSVPEEDIVMSAKEPLKVLGSKLSKTSGTLFQKAKVEAGVTPKEERMIAGIGDPSGWKRVADKMSAKFERTGDLSVGEALAWKKSASELARAPKNAVKSGGALYKQDASKAQSILQKKAETNPLIAKVLKTQEDVSKSLARRAFGYVFPYNQSGKAAVARTITAGGASMINPLLAAFFSPLTAGALTFPTAIASKGISKGFNFASKNRATRQALLAAALAGIER